MEVTFDKLWKDIQERSQRWEIPIVQDYKELEHVFNLMKGCGSYLEVGAAEGNTLYLLGQALKSDNIINYVDYGEAHTKEPRQEAINRLGGFIYGIKGNSHNAKIIFTASCDKDKGLASYECVMIDAGHTYEDVIADAIAYGHLATKYIFFHDIQLPEVHKAFDWYCAQNPQFKVSTFINSSHYGYGILEV